MSAEQYPWLQFYPEKPNWNMAIPDGHMAEVFDLVAAEKPDEIAVDFLEKTFTWGVVSKLVNKFAAGLQSHGVGKGDKVGLFLPNCPYFIIAYYAVLKTGATVVNYNPLYAERELAHQIKDSETKIMITLDLTMLYKKAKKMLTETPLQKLVICPFADVLPFPQNFLFPVFKFRDKAWVRPGSGIIFFKDLIDHDRELTPVKLDLRHDIAVLQYTGGTTGVPKGAMLTHANIYANAVQSFANFPALNEQPKMLAVLPFFHVFAMTVCLNVAVMGRMQIITVPRFDLDQTLQILHRKRPHYMPAVPAIFGAINHHPRLHQFDLSSLEFCISGGAALPIEVKKQFEEKTGAVVVEGYGLTESSPVATVNPPRGENVAGSIGLPLPQTIIEILDPDDKKTPVPLGERGELCITGPQVMKGYWNKPEDTAAVLRNGRLYTGDIAIMDARGYVYIVDRIKDMIITNGYNVYPRNIEEAIYMNTAVEECIVAGLPDEKRGEIVKAWIKLKDGKTLSEEDLKDFLKDKISKMEIPKLIEFRNIPLPKTMIGKLSRKDVLAEELNK